MADKSLRGTRLGAQSMESDEGVETDTALSVVGLRLLRHWAVSLGAAEDTFDPAFTDRPATLIKVVRYPGTSDTPQGVGANKD